MDNDQSQRPGDQQVILMRKVETRLCGWRKDWGGTASVSVVWREKGQAAASLQHLVASSKTKTLSIFAAPRG